MTCSHCLSTEFRLSRFRWPDLESLALLQYPVRCSKCNSRAFVGLPLALVLLQAGRAKRASAKAESH